MVAAVAVVAVIDIVVTVHETLKSDDAVDFVIEYVMMEDCVEVAGENVPYVGM